MKLPKALLGAILVGVAAQTTACSKGGEPTPKEKQLGQTVKGVVKAPANCPACGMG